MGYEVKLIVGEPSDYADHGNEHYFMVAATIDLCKPGYDSNIMQALRKAKDKLYYYYGSDGNIKITDDCYGDRSDIHSLDEIICALRKDVATDEYRRFKWALALLESINNNNGKDMKVMWYGH